MNIKKIILIIVLLFCVILCYFGGTALIAYLDWHKNKSRLLNNLFEYHEKLITYNEKNKYIILNDEGKVTEINPSVIYDNNNKIIGEFSPTKREIVQLSKIPENLIQSLVSIEDRNFYNHKGINYKGILRAFIKNLLSLRIIEGGSSITQQLSKILFTSRRRNIYRKFLELYGSVNIEKKFSKDDILLMYLNTVYFGHGSYGVQSASKLYFNKNVRNLNQFEIALLICIIPAPNYFSPFNNIELAKRKHLIILNSLKQHNLISVKNFENRYNYFWNNFKNKLNISSISYWKMNVNKAPYVVEYIRQYLAKQFTVSEILRGSLEISTTIDLSIQTIVQDSIREYFKYLRTLYTNKKYKENLQVSIIVSKPSTGDILGFVGGENFTFKNQLNRAFHIKRQVGSSFKPFIYAVGIEEEMFTLTTILTDKPVKFKDKNRYYEPKNYSLKYRGPIFYQDGLIKSINTISVQILNHISPKKLINNYLNRIYLDAGATLEFLPVLSLALGTVEMSPYELSVAYDVLANGGEKVFPLLVRGVKNQYNEDIIDNISIQSNIINKWDKNHNKRIFSRGTTYIIADTLKKVFSPEGTARYALKNNPLKIKLCGKTGTTSGFKDAWCVGYTKDYIVIVWIGFDDYSQSLGSGMTGGRLASPLILKIFDKMYWNKTYQDFNIPGDEIIFCNIDAKSGKLASTGSTNILHNVPFLVETEPKDY